VSNTASVVWITIGLMILLLLLALLNNDPLLF
jgi:hypothetical protein